MVDFTSIQPELRYGCPAADQILFNRFYTVGYSYYFRQAKWAMEIVDPDKRDMTQVERENDFRPDFRVPKRFRADLSDYTESEYDRGHLVPSADLTDTEVQNSETFLLSNMSPQKPNLNRQMWRKLESAVRDLDQKKNVFETYVISGPIFDFKASISMIGADDKNGIQIPIPSHFFKCILTVNKGGKLNMWAFEMENKKLTGAVGDYRVSTSHIEQRAGIFLWDNLLGPEIEQEKKRKRAMW